MTRVKRGVAANKRRKNMLAKAKGFRWARSKKFAAAKQAVIKAGKYAHRDRRAKKRTFRSLWIIRLGNALRELGLTYRGFIALEKEKNIALDRKVLSEMAMKESSTFAKFIETVK